jgi:hypothetical protein
MVSSMQVVTVGNVGMMPGLFMVPTGIVLGRFFVMAGRMFMVLRRLGMMFCAFLAHMEGIRIFWSGALRISNPNVMIVVAS